MAGTHPKVVAEMLGHSRISTTLDLYSHVTPTMQRQAAEALDAVSGLRSDPRVRWSPPSPFSSRFHVPSLGLSEEGTLSDQVYGLQVDSAPMIRNCVA